MAHDTFEEDYELANGHTNMGAVARQFHNQMMEKKDAEITKLRAERDVLITSFEEILLLEAGLGTTYRWIELRRFKDTAVAIIRAALAEKV